MERRDGETSAYQMCLASQHPVLQGEQARAGEIDECAKRERRRGPSSDYVLLCAASLDTIREPRRCTGMMNEGEGGRG